MAGRGGAGAPGRPWLSARCVPQVQENIERFFTRFVEEGKATVRLREPAVDVCLSGVGAQGGPRGHPRSAARLPGLGSSGCSGLPQHG